MDNPSEIRVWFPGEKAGSDMFVAPMGLSEFGQVGTASYLRLRLIGTGTQINGFETQQASAPNRMVKENACIFAWLLD
jgi:hypothetical protein